MIKFPTTISEYTDGKLWRQGVDESIARRILVDLHKIEDKQELDLRKMYLAHFYCQIGEYRLAATLAKGFLLENKFVDDAVALIKKICIEDRDIETFARLVKLMDNLYHGKPPLSFFDDVDGDELLMAFEENKDTGKGQVVYNAGMAEYYQNGKLIFSVEDKNYEAFVKDSAARFFLSESQPESAIELLLTLKLSKLKPDIKMFCHQTFVRAYCMMEQYKEAYDYSVLLMDNGVYIPEMTDIFVYLYREKSPHFERMREFLVNYKQFGSIQLGDMHSLARDIDDEDFWKRIYEGNPIDSSDISEETYLFKGILAFNRQEYQLAERLFSQATAIYGRFGKASLFKYYLDCFQKKLKKNPIVDDMPCELFTARIDEIYSFIDKKLLSKLKKCLSREDFVKNFDDNILEIDNMLSGVSAKVSDLVDIVNRVYKMNFTPVCELIKKVIVDSEYNVFIRAICLANFMMYSNQKKFIIGKNIYENPFVKRLKFNLDGDKASFAYGIAIYIALSILEGIENDALKKECDILNKISSKAKGDYSQITPLAVFGVLIAYFSQEKVHYDKDIVKKREVKAFAQAYAVDGDFFGDSGVGEIDDEDVFDFFRYCLEIL
ncbi:MAG: hypothetical protein K2G42_02705 [Clostridia bacterium]|nr:hypothetical protein [Clostridia bacterium]